MREVLFVAGEPSGDLHGAGVAAELRRRAPGIPMEGIGGARMEAAGVSLLEHTDRLAVMGFVEVLKHIPLHWRLLAQLKQRLRSGKVGLVIVLDYPGFNMKVAAAAHAAGVPVLYYITPQVWAWGAKRLTELARTVTRAAVILPFEEELLRAAGIDATFVGHPLLDRAEAIPSREEARAALGLPAGAPVLALFPGSRRSEIARHLAPFVATARELERRIPGLRVVVSVAPGITLDPAECPFQQVHAGSFTVWRAADAALSKSGTSTLEAAVAGCPLIVAYRTSAVTFAIARRVVTIPRIGLVNVVAGKEVAPEFVQDAVRPDAMADALAPLLDRESPRRAAMLEGLAAVRAQLGTPGAAGRVADIALAMALP
ncbi:MAG TPA: lipid-A-disaccharide synthase [Gemmatimonadaceae bacterium]|nr:lipid-A-disaccharide synthase [Gemmatimonadaceae bacterium]